MIPKKRSFTVAVFPECTSLLPVKPVVREDFGIQEGTQCTKCKNEWALKASIALLYVLCTLLVIAVAVLGYKAGSIIS
ncbi:Collectin-12 [Liparis tanakae]|uniref:Collectin-12 n=1 Tax=Liparis tanakae TaxID=230148 RepID=A0A4Z2HLM1_9TELE|nr:Collectin-12 [Liparis tanakae]